MGVLSFFFALCQGVTRIDYICKDILGVKKGGGVGEAVAPLAPPLFIGALLILIPTVVLLPTTHKDIFPYFIDFLPTLILELYLLGDIFSIQAISDVINAEEVR